MRELTNDNSTRNTDSSFITIRNVLIFLATLILVSMMTFFIAILAA